MRQRTSLLAASLPLSFLVAGCTTHATTSSTSGAGGGNDTTSSTGADTTTTVGATTSSSGTGGQGPMHTHGPIPDLVKVGTAEYSTGLLMSDGRVMMASGQVTPVLTPLPNLPAGTKFIDYAGGLHQSVFVDSNHRVWTWGATDHGIQGSGMDGGDPTIPYRVMVDSTGADFSDVDSVVAGYAYDGAVKSDGSVWVWGQLDNGMTGDGTIGGLRSKPTRVPLPAGVKIKKLVFSDVALALADDGTVWSWGGTNVYGFPDVIGRNTTDGTTPGKVEGLPQNVVDVVSGGDFSYALTSDNKLFGWGWNTKLGVTSQSSITQPVTDMSKIVSLPAPVKFVAANDHTTHVILTDGSLWGWGDDAMGEVGDGHEIDWNANVPPHSTGMDSWDWGRDDMPVLKPVRIAPDVSNFKAVYTNTAFVFYVFAVTDDGYLYSWGRNKTGDLMNGIVPAAPLYGNISATYPNGWDVTSPQNVNPFEVTANKEVTAPYCVANPTGTPCNQFDNTTGKAVYEH